MSDQPQAAASVQKAVAFWVEGKKFDARKALLEARCIGCLAKELIAQKPPKDMMSELIAIKTAPTGETYIKVKELAS